MLSLDNGSERLEVVIGMRGVAGLESTRWYGADQVAAFQWEDAGCKAAAPRAEF